MFLKESKQDIYEVDYLIDILTALSYSVFSLSAASAAERVQSFPTFASTATKQINNTYIVVVFFFDDDCQTGWTRKLFSKPTKLINVCILCAI